MSRNPATERRLGIFGHAKNPAEDYLAEVRRIEALASEVRLGRGDGVALDHAISRAMRFRVGGIPECLDARQRLRALESEFAGQQTILPARLTPVQVFDILRLLELAAGDCFDSDAEADRMGPIVDTIKARYRDLKGTAGSFQAASRIARGEGICRLLGIDPSGIEPLVLERQKERFAAAASPSADQEGVP